MQIGPRIRIGGTLGKLGQKAKIGIGKTANVAGKVVSVFNPALGTAISTAGDVLDTSDGAFDFKKAAKNAALQYGVGKVLNMGGKSLMSHLPGGGGGAGAVEGLPGGDIAGASDPSRFRGIGGFLKEHGRTITDLGTLGEGIYDRYQKNSQYNDARKDYEAAKPLRDAAMAGLLDTSRPDLSYLFADPMNPQGRYRRVNVGSTGGY